ncbi:DUF1631 domain-containing protein [Rhodanobacter denitrificans]|uniref:DUF1631 family protein n=1 Tax=Rhodanobacter denitrificans TaxID=666685 RepID=UPI000260C807|nr:DUF1631 family protein [Rhodanobacter denitrificans]EIM03631.1 hypothetical protein UUC_06067 [Rhodanobacter denitrificans]UJM91152.1 DUF1631 domain-containing protein [Rhodanobacter denitrificans]
MDVGHDRRHSSASPQGGRVGNARWPARTQRLLEASYHHCVEGLQEPLRRCLGEFEKQLFALAERAHHAGEQQDCFASRQHVLQGRTAYTQRFMERLGSVFNDIDRASAAPPATHPKPWQALTLVDPGEQEVSMALEQLGARGEVRHASVLYELGHRLAVLVGAPPLEGQALPLGPYALARACHEASAELELPLPHQLLLLQHFDQWVLQALAPLYDIINAQLQGDGILPQLRSIPIPRHVGKRARPATAGSSGAAGEPAATGTATAHAGGAGAGPTGGSGAPIEVLESLRDLLARQRASQSGISGQAVGRAASEQELQSALGALQQHLAQVTDQAGRELRSAARLREELLAQLNVGKPGDAPRTQLSDEQGDKVELVARLFEQLGQQLQQGGNAHQLLGSLQLPVLRMAVADRGFFEKREHPARRLLDTVTAAANDWLDGSDDESNRPLATKLEQLVSRASQEPPSAGLYTTLLADIEHHLALLTRKAQAAERRHVEAAQGRERLDQARHRAGELMAERFAQSPPRGLLRALLDRAWSDVLALTLLRHGEDSEAFGMQLAITDQLLGRLPVGDRLQLQAEVESGLQQIGMHVEEAVQVAQRLLGAGKPDPAVELPSATDLALRLKQHQRLGQLQSTPQHEPAAAAQPDPAPAPSPRERSIEQHLRELPFGSWFEFVDPGTGTIARRKLAWHSPMSGRCLLVSRRGQRGEEMSLAQLAHEVASGRACEVPAQPESLLDRAWRSLTGSLRQTTASRHPTPPEAARR